MEPTLPIRARDARDAVSKSTAEGFLLDPEEMFRCLYNNAPGLRTVDAKTLVMGLVNMAKRRSARRWLENAAYCGTIMFSDKWVNENIGKTKRKPSKTRPKAAASQQPSPIEENSDESPKRSWKNQRPHRPQSRSPEPSRPTARSGSRLRAREHPQSPSWELEPSRPTVRRKSRHRTRETHRQGEARARTLPTSRYRTDIHAQEEARDRTRRERSDQRKRERSPETTFQSSRSKTLRTEDEARDRTQLNVTATCSDMSGAPVLESSQGRGRVRKRGQRKEYSCPMSGCEETTLRLKWHVLHNHAPGIFNEDITPSEGVSNRIYAALSILAKSLNGPIARVEDLVELLNNFQLIGEAWEIQANQEEVMTVMCRVMNWPLPESFSLTPVNSPACLIHWRALTALLQNLSPNVREDLQRAFSSQQADDLPAPVGERDAEREQSPEPAPGRQTFDSHFHLDRLQRSLGLSYDASFLQTMAAIGNIPEQYRVNLAGCTAVFCDPDTYPSADRIDELAMDSISVTIGVHPKHKTLSEEEEMMFFRSFSHQNVVALGEIGLDYTSNFMDWLRQERQFLKLLNHTNFKNVVVVLHLRGLASEPLGREVYLQALALASEKLKKWQIIHLHCFCGPEDIVQAWFRHFPNTYFGFTGMVKNFDNTKCQALRSVPGNCLLLETDAPYFNPKGFEVSAPCLLGYMAEVVADIRDESVEEVFSQTTANALRIYMGAVGDP